MSQVNMAIAAVSEVDNDLAQFGGAGPTLDALSASLIASDTNGQANDYAAVNLGQLKHMVQPFYDRLIALGYTGAPLIGGTASPTYPWLASGLVANDYAAANIGQVKNLFSFDVTYSSAGDGIPDWWAIAYYSGTSVDPNGFVAWSGSQVTNLAAYENGWNPVDYYNDHTPLLTIVSGSGQTGSPGGYVSAPLVVSVTDTNGNPLTGAPVIFAAASGTLQASSTGAPVAGLTMFADGNGQAQVYFELPPSLSSTSQITASAGPPAEQAHVTFSEASDSGTGTYVSPFAPTNVIGTMNGDGSETLTWENNDQSGPIYIYQLQSSGTWTVVATLTPGTTSYVVSPSEVGSTETGNGFSSGGSTGSTSGGNGNGSWSSNGNPGNPGYVAIPVQSYAAIDVSGAYSPGSGDDIQAIALDDNNNGAFAYITDAESFDTDVISQPWVNGTDSASFGPGFGYDETSVGFGPSGLTGEEDFYLDPEGSLPVFGPYSSAAPTVAPDGTIYGTLSIEPLTTSTSGTTPVDEAFGFRYGPAGSVAEADDGNSSFNIPTVPAYSNDMFVTSELTGCSANGYFGYVCYEVTSDGTSSFQYYSFVDVGGGTVGEWEGYDEGATYDFEPIALSDSGYAIGQSGYSGEGLFMNQDGSISEIGDGDACLATRTRTARSISSSMPT
jgi:hypothetical protein